MSKVDASKPIPWPANGCTIDDALRRLFPELLDAAIEAYNAWRNAGGGQRRMISGGIGHDNQFYAAREREIRRLEKELSLAVEECRAPLLQLLRAGTVIAIGSRESPSNSPTVVRARAWPYMRIVNAEQSIVEERTPVKTRWYGIVIYPTPLSAHAKKQLLAQAPVLPKPVSVKRAARTARAFHVKPPMLDDVRPTTSSQELTPHNKSIHDAVEALSREPDWKSLMAKERDGRIQDWQQDNNRPVTSDRAIRRYLQNRAR